MHLNIWEPLTYRTPVRIKWNMDLDTWTVIVQCTLTSNSLFLYVGHRKKYYFSKAFNWVFCLLEHKKASLSLQMSFPAFLFYHLPLPWSSEWSVGEGYGQVYRWRLQHTRLLGLLNSFVTASLDSTAPHTLSESFLKDYFTLTLRELVDTNHKHLQWRAHETWILGHQC